MKLLLMLEELINLVKEHAGTAVISNPAIPDQHNETVVAEAGSSILNGLKNMVSGGQAQEVLNLFNHQGGDISTNPAAQNISGDFIKNIMSKCGLDQATASNVAGNLIPNVLQQLVQKTSTPGGSGGFDLQGMLGQLTGGQGVQGLIGSLEHEGAGGIMDKIKGMFSV
jgi:hypothetical protein